MRGTGRHRLGIVRSCAVTRQAPDARFVDVSDPDDPDTTWRVDAAFLESNWTCIWGRGCVGILDEPAEALGHGCCSLGAELLDDDEAMLVSALAATLDPSRFQHHEALEASGPFDEQRRAASAREGRHHHHTRVVDGACIFLNRTDFDGPQGCALHIAALDADESPTEWKPSVCWQLPIKIERPSAGSSGTPLPNPARSPNPATPVVLRRWTRSDFGPGGADMAWMCSEDLEPASAYVGAQPVIESLRHELDELLGERLVAAIETAIAHDRSDEQEPGR